MLVQRPWKRCRTVAVPVPTSYAVAESVWFRIGRQGTSTEREALTRLSFEAVDQAGADEEVKECSYSYWCLAGNIREKKVTNRSGSECQRKSTSDEQLPLGRAEIRRRSLTHCCFALAVVNVGHGVQCSQQYSVLLFKKNT